MRSIGSTTALKLHDYVAGQLEHHDIQPADKRWQLGVRVENQLLFDRTIEETGSANGWHDIVVDLSPFAGRTIPIQLLHAAPKQQQTEVFWKRATMVIE